MTADERQSLEELVKRKVVSGLKRVRAQILLMADDHQTDQEIADDLGIGLATVERVRERCCERGVVECLDRITPEQPSRPRKFDGESEARLVQIACSVPPEKNASFVQAMEDVLEVYHRPYDPHGTANIFAAVEPLTGNCLVVATDRRTAKDTAKFLKRISDEMFPNAKAIAETFLSTLSIQCLEARIPNKAALDSSLAKWARDRIGGNVTWRFTTEDARIKLRRLYPSFPDD